MVTAAFWVIKILTTGMGEALADFFDHTFDPVIVVALSGVVLAVALWLQIRAEAFFAWRYWFAVSMVSVFGTLAADAVHVMLSVSYWISSLFFLVSLFVVFTIWKLVEGSISISRIVSIRQELFYWTVVMTANTFGWGFLVSGLIFAVAFAIPSGVSSLSKFGAVGAFWGAYVLTRPFGASIADWLALPPERGGVGFGTLNVSLALIAAIAIFVAANRDKVKL
jgi:uncharacterized membrane-anchored protein